MEKYDMTDENGGGRFDGRLRGEKQSTNSSLSVSLCLSPNPSVFSEQRKLGLKIFHFFRVDKYSPSMAWFGFERERVRECETVNGVDVREIDRRGKPLMDKTQYDPQTHTLSLCPFPPLFLRHLSSFHVR
jgi:hypothetical protein